MPRKPASVVEPTIEPEVVDTLVPATVGSTALAAPADKHDFRGKSDLDQSDLQIPRLALAQSSTPQTKRGNKAEIEGLREGDFFNTVTEEIYGPTVEIVVLKVTKTAAVFDRTGKVIERDVAWDDPRCEFTEDEHGERKQPIASRCYDYLVLLPQYTTEDGPALAYLRLKRTQMPAAKKLNTWLQLTTGPSWARVLKLTAVPDEANGNAFVNIRVAQGNRTPVAMQQQAEELFEAFGSRTITIDEGKASDLGDEVAPAANEDVPY